MSESSNPVSTTSAMKQIVKWSESQPLSDWQRDALRRLYQTCPLSSEDEEELFAICKNQHLLLDDGESTATPVPLKKDHIPAGDVTSSPVTIRSISHVKHVNALADNQAVLLQEQGITVVFGNNASGKSGYARILKSACRARSGEDILHNIYELQPTDPASARITFSIGGVSQPAFDWRGDASSVDDLSLVSVFDAHCAMTHVDEKNEAAYTPIPLHILKELSDICRRFKTQFQKMTSALAREVPVGLRDLRCSRESKAGRFLHDLDSTSSFDTAKQLADVSAEEQAKITELKSDLQSDLQKVLSLEQGRKQRVDAVVQRVEGHLQGLGDDTAHSFHAALDLKQAKAENVFCRARP